MSDPAPKLPYYWPPDWTAPAFKAEDGIFWIRDYACRLVDAEIAAMARGDKSEPNEENLAKALAFWRAAAVVEAAVDKRKGAQR